MHAVYAPYVLLAAIAIAAIVAVSRDLISTMQFRIAMIGSGVLALVWAVVMGVLWPEHG
ncbi:hypothetical protein IC762_19395 [Bradyrhizobium genosp. L]|uniref:hypothetical protein n=1 Tax=Bradyrhizobium genosp. L TaxID=83637 RepID=UPI0018A29F71|nr:hypothetical protein [Bradyrhizobium genosp. L]QPF81961.1 hypothetical protein IC762_19395 [Bradyrhizobium genosp. L]